MGDKVGEKVGHRPVGSGSREARIVGPIAGQQAGRIFIGRALWQQLGSPNRVDVVRAPGALVIKKGDRFAVLGPSSDGEPRLSVGRSTLEALTLLPGTYAGVVEGTNKRRIVINLSTEKGEG